MIAWLAQRVRRAIETGVENAIWIGLGVCVLFVWKFASGDVKLPIWLLALAVGAPLALTVRARRQGRLPPAEAAGYIAELENQNALYGYYANFLWEVMQTLQKASRG